MSTPQDLDMSNIPSRIATVIRAMETRLLCLESKAEESHQHRLCCQTYQLRLKTPTQRLEMAQSKKKNQAKVQPNKKSR